MKVKIGQNNISIIPVFECLMNLKQALKKNKVYYNLKEVIKYCSYYKSI